MNLEINNTLVQNVILQLDDKEKSLLAEVNFLVSSFLKKIAIDVDNLEYLGDGSYGFAYSEKKTLSKARVIKFTIDPNEVLIAKSLIGKENKHIADIYEVFQVHEKYHLIVQEKLNTNNKKLLESAEHIFEIMYDQDLEFRKVVKSRSIHNVINNKNQLFGEKCPKSCIDIIKSAYEAFEECKVKTGFISEDMHLSNMGIKGNGEIAFFDHTFF